ncbi:bifunctional UDP-N-acetylglucosamine diphosphorylase/glucosamine-1-phosphate N-acetyltransferase GlmU [Natroniella sp. ANB-PHB2]|uniref:bifunctional UDP-N-acetylglucosamine diphosphorylase/glucosamine-1-phosphate N-acetyltransferase GlmU n=1 Tax=Natroniella sp. ANB-PHB2 TaxID=3384444 RepID=UPI0038D3C19E
MTQLVTITLAAGKGTRMKSNLPKVLHQVAGKSMVQHVVDTASDLEPVNNIAIVGYKSELVKEETEGEIEFVKQEEQLGTGHAVMQAQDKLASFSGTVLVLYGDTPLLTVETLEELLAKRQSSNSAMTVLTTKVVDPTGYGRIVRDDNGQIARIVEEKDTSSQEAKIDEINTGICAFDSQLLVENLTELEADNAQGEYYLTDLVGILVEKGERVSALLTANHQETIGVNSRRHLAKAEKTLRKRICNHHLDRGVTIIDPANTYIDAEVEIGQDSIICPFTFLEGETKLGSEVVIGSQSRIVDSELGDGVEVKSSTIVESKVGDDSLVGPYAYLRPGSELAENVKVSDFVEVKKSQIGSGSKVPHLSYIGDAKIGQNVNVGAGTITANYDGQNKHQTVIEDDVFVGSDSTLIAPVKIGQGAVTGAGAVVKDDVEDGDTIVGVPAKSFR